MTHIASQRVAVLGQGHGAGIGTCNPTKCEHGDTSPRNTPVLTHRSVLLTPQSPTEMSKEVLDGFLCLSAQSCRWLRVGNFSLRRSSTTPKRSSCRLRHGPLTSSSPVAFPMARAFLWLRPRRGDALVARCWGAAPSLRHASPEVH
jgi:hypothetical protein